MKRTGIAAALALMFAMPALADESPVLAPGSNAQMKQIYDADQGDRTTMSMKPGTQERDALRREQTHQLLAGGQLHTGQDYTEAAYVFQHGKGDDFLLAHTLAVIATKKGDPEGPKIAAMTLDRYLQSHGAKQIYGTQYNGNSLTGEWTNEPYNRDLISDALRHELNVRDLAAQQAELEKYRANTVKPPEAPAPAGGPALAPQSNQTTISCATQGMERVFVRDKWSIAACGDKAVMAMDDTPTGRGILFAIPFGTTVKVSRVGTGGDAAEIAVATAAFGAMTPAQLADLAAQSKGTP